MEKKEKNGEKENKELNNQNDSFFTKKRCIFLLYAVDNIISFWGKNVKKALRDEKNQLKIWLCQKKYIPLHRFNKHTFYRLIKAKKK